MTVSELIAALQALPGDMKVQVLDSESMGPTDICQVSRGSWSDDPSDGEEIDDDWDPEEEPEFVQDDEGGKIAVLVTW
jgi:hypothetical protein